MVNVEPSGIGADGATTGLFAGHGKPFCAVPPTCGEQAGGFGLVALTGFTLEIAWAAGSASSWPFGSPGYVGCTNANVAGEPFTATELTAMFGPEAEPLRDARSKSKLRSVRHCVERTVRSTCVPGRNRFVGAS